MTAARVRPEFLKALEDFDMTVGADLKPRLREMIRLRVSHINGCSYCIRLHSEQLAAQGASPVLISALARPVKLMRHDLISEGDAAAVRFAEILTDYPRGLEVEARELAGEFFTRKQLGAIVETVAVTNAWNRVTRGTE
ncbi:carboxymuconolactone decarboxylase family protein [Demequina sp. B12]|uniref:carboxymuconolactone decarboxylase family protein n=1 Tax=Demequina sp. B12 TaxID=2992757 RepID=UPI00237B4175|nr:carboxymuconolactone decarboxylase family protein [Demequina sp. B12]MDE0573492.1 carboxymuconolactone decarboxylase family protein [Demequina sp. B12]